MSEFGRTARENGNRGTDHGHANVMFVLGGPVKGGKVYGRWPGLDQSQLYEGRDLALTTDFRQVIGEAVARHMGNKNLAAVFPGYDNQPGKFLRFLGVGQTESPRRRSRREDDDKLRSEMPSTEHLRLSALAARFRFRSTLRRSRSSPDRPQLCRCASCTPVFGSHASRATGKRPCRLRSFPVPSGPPRCRHIVIHGADLRRLRWRCRSSLSPQGNSLASLVVGRSAWVVSLTK